MQQCRQIPTKQFDAREQGHCLFYDPGQDPGRENQERPQYQQGEAGSGNRPHCRCEEVGAPGFIRNLDMRLRAKDFEVDYAPARGKRSQSMTALVQANAYKQREHPEENSTHPVKAVLPPVAISQASVGSSLHY